MNRPREQASSSSSSVSPSVFHRLSGDPGRSLSARSAHHGARVFLLALLALTVALLFPPSQGATVETYTQGMVAPEDVIAEIAFRVPKTAEELEVDRRVLEDAVAPTFDFLPQLADSMLTSLGILFDDLDSAAVANDPARFATVLRQGRIVATEAQVTYLMEPAARVGFRAAAEGAANRLIRQGVVEPSQVASLTTTTITVREGADERSVLAETVLDSRDFLDEAVLMLPPMTPPEVSELLKLVLYNHLQPSYIFNVVATDTDRAAAGASVDRYKEDVLQGQAIVRAADPIGPDALARLNAHEAAMMAAGLIEPASLPVSSMFGAVLLNFMLFGLFGLLLFFNRPEVYGNFRWLLLIGLLVAAYFGAGYGIERAAMAPQWLPIAFVALPVAVLWDTRMALFLVLVLASITGTLPPFSDYGVVLVVTAGGAAAALSVRAVRRRSETWVSIAIIATTAALVLFAHGLVSGTPFGDVAQGTAAVAGNATVSALLAMGFLFVFELFTGITTDQTLLEWADPTRPLLRRLSLEAPGTYAHTINVSNLAEAAATRIGAHGLLCRVGVYYHDVGKMLKPHYFVENQPDGRNPHDKLKPQTSASIVREHVTEGVRLARDAKVPEVVIPFILEHHGTQRIGFFYDKACEDAGEALDPDRFSYPGPKPQSRETAIVMLADSCESATRAMVDPTPERVRDLIHSIVDSKIADGQLDEAPLTLAEIAQVKEQFVKILSGVIHRRIEYPATKHLTDAEGAEGENGNAAVPEGDDAPDSSGDAADRPSPADASAAS